MEPSLVDLKTDFFYLTNMKNVLGCMEENNPSWWENPLYWW